MTKKLTTTSKRAARRFLIWKGIKIGDDIEIIIVDIRGDGVSLGITAPKGVTVHRKEVYEAIRSRT